MPKSGKVPDSIKKAIAGEIEDPQLAEIAAHFFQMAGGTRAFARMLYDEYKAARAGTMIRQRILDMLLRVTKIANDQNGTRDSLGLLTDADLERELEASMNRLPKVADGEQAAGETSDPAGAAPGRT